MRVAGKKRFMNAVKKSLPLERAASRMRAASARLFVIVFSQMTSLPAANASRQMAR